MSTIALRHASVIVAGMTLAPCWAKASTLIQIYQFKGGSDGAKPYGDLIDVGGKLYGTTAEGGGSCGCGTVFSVTPSGDEKVVYAFKGGADGALPEAGLIDVGGTLYTTTASGGGSTNCTDGCGTVVKIIQAGAETILHTFKRSDGEFPDAGLINAKGIFYGTTLGGGNPAYCSGGCGTVFSITRLGTEKVVYSFKGITNNDGANPHGGVIYLGGMIYGTTSFGGNPNENHGIVFALTPSGKETELYVFRGLVGDGAAPNDSLLNINGTLYGTTYDGGDNSKGSCTPEDGCGTVFAETTTGTETVLGEFTHPQTGHPNSSLHYIAKTGELYGTTVGDSSGLGAVFRVKP